MVTKYRKVSSERLLGGDPNTEWHQERSQINSSTSDEALQELISKFLGRTSPCNAYSDKELSEIAKAADLVGRCSLGKLHRYANEFALLAGVHVTMEPQKTGKELLNDVEHVREQIRCNCNRIETSALEWMFRVTWSPLFRLYPNFPELERLDLLSKLDELESLIRSSMKQKKRWYSDVACYFVAKAEMFVEFLNPGIEPTFASSSDGPINTMMLEIVNLLGKPFFIDLGEEEPLRGTYIKFWRNWRKNFRDLYEQAK